MGLNQADYQAMHAAIAAAARRVKDHARTKGEPWALAPRSAEDLDDELGSDVRAALADAIEGSGAPAAEPPRADVREFFVVVKDAPGRMYFQMRHPTQGAAETEAERLAGKEGGTFIVLRAVFAARRREDVVRLTVGPDGDLGEDFPF